jgi:ParB family chromosome partitioning protein
MATAQKPRITLGGLSPLLDINELDDAPAPAARSEEAPRMALEFIDPDPNQPRKEFNPETLKELADSIKSAGDVLQPISLRPNPDRPGYFIINFGHRRYLAAHMAGLADVPYFIGHQCDSFAQVIENEQRDNLRPLELAAFIRDRMADGFSQQEIARRLGKSKSAISTAATLAEAPPVVVEALRSGKVDGVSPAYELVKLHAVHPEAVASFIAEAQSIPRAAVSELRERLESPPPAATVSAHAAEAPALAPAKPAKAPAAAGQPAKPAPVARALLGEYKGQPLVLNVDREPGTDGRIYGRRPGTNRWLNVPAAEVKLVGFGPV